MTVWKTIDNNPEQARFKSIINQKTKFEDRLPVLYQSLNELKQVIDEKYNKVTEIKERVVTLDRLYEEIGNLENEDNN
jgi:archaellum component FlaC